MKFLNILLYSLVGLSHVASAETKNACFSVEGMTCAACTVTAKAAIKKLKGIQDIKVSIEDKSAFIKFDDALTTPAEIKSKIDSVGYKASVKQCDKG